MKKPSLILLALSSIFQMLLPTTQANSINREWAVFEQNSLIAGLRIGHSTIQELFTLLGEGTALEPKDKHQLTRFCYMGSKTGPFLTAFTGHLHDFNTLYGVEISHRHNTKGKKFKRYFLESVDVMGGSASLVLSTV